MPSATRTNLVELNGDGHIDILSGSFSRRDGEDMAGLFHVLWGNQDGTFRAPEALKGSDGTLLIVTASDEGGTDLEQKAHTRPTAVDLDSDGMLDLVSGNSGGMFAFFRGEGGGRFESKSTWLQAGGKNMHVPGYSDPFFIDWDQDGDLDLLSGSKIGGVFLFTNQGSKTAPKFAASVTLLPPSEHAKENPELRFGDAHVTGPMSATRVFAADVNTDGKLDLLVGDQFKLTHLLTGVTEAEAKAKIEAFEVKRKELLSLMVPATAPEEQVQKCNAEFQVLAKELDKFRREESLGFVWLLLQKSSRFRAH